VTLRHTFGDAQQKVVEALAFGVFVNFKPCNRIFAQVLHLQYTDRLVSRPVTVCPAARSGVGGMVTGMLSSSLHSLFSDLCIKATKLRKQHQTVAGFHNSDRLVTREPQGVSLARKSDTT
jgi:hypothetical protein